MIKWIVEDNSDVKYIQEFSTNGESDAVDVYRKIDWKENIMLIFFKYLANMR
jgi:hypothetical protein